MQGSIIYGDDDLPPATTIFYRRRRLSTADGDLPLETKIIYRRRRLTRAHLPATTFNRSTSTRDLINKGVLKDLEGVWSNEKKRRKFVKATNFGDALPEKLENLACSSPSPLGIQLDSCKEAAFYIKSLYVANPLEEGDIMLTENDSHVDNQHKVPMMNYTSSIATDKGVFGVRMARWLCK
ncbi:hypothetical protein Tco_1236289 [Tanacetum coccineum]